MTPSAGHPTDELQLLLDERLESAQRQDVETHLAGCERCRRELEALRRVTGLLRDNLPPHPVPAHLARRVSDALTAESQPRVLRGKRRWAAGAVLAAAAALALLLGRGGPAFVQAAVADFAAYRSGALSLELATDDPATLERHFAAAGLPFPTRVFDFAMMGYALTGGGAHRLAGRQSAAFAYRHASGERVLCQMYLGDLGELPAAVEQREHDGIGFSVYRVNDLTLVFWQEGPVVCVLVADGDPEAAIQLAYAKAVKV